LSGKRESGFGLGTRGPFGLFEKALGRLVARWAFLPPWLFLAAPLILAGTRRSSPRVALAVAARLNTIARRQRNLEFDDFIPDRVGALVIRYCQQFPQATARILWRWFIANRLCRRLCRSLGFGDRRLGGLFFTHIYIIARIIGFGSFAKQVFRANVGFFLRPQGGARTGSSLDPDRDSTLAETLAQGK
jgi:hypothetical protein